LYREREFGFAFCPPSVLSIEENRMPNPAPIRRAPVQERSSETVAAILDAASSLLERVPFDQITTSRIAEAAGVSVGGLYRFFSDKQEIFDAIALRGLEAFRSELSGVLAPHKLLIRRRKPIDAVLDAYVDFLDRHPAFRTLALGRHISDQTRADQVQPNLGPAALLKDYLVSQFHWKPGAALDLKLRVSAEVGDRLIAFAFEQPSRAGRDEVLTELKRLLGAYLFS
jgi:AcrR family transcriptional regulator